MSAYILRNGSAAAILKKCLPRQLNNNNFVKVISSKLTTTKLIKFNKWFQFVRKEERKTLNCIIYYIIVQLFFIIRSLVENKSNREVKWAEWKEMWTKNLTVCKIVHTICCYWEHHHSLQVTSVWTVILSCLLSFIRRRWL